MRFTAIILIAIVMLGMGACNNDQPPKPENGQQQRELTAAEKQTLRSANTFGITLFKTIANEEHGNVFVSPFSVSMALGMTLNGARTTTFDAMRTALAFDGLEQKQINESYRGVKDLLPQLDPAVMFTVANSIWHRNDVQVEQPFIDGNKRHFDADVTGLDFSDPTAPKTMNDWVSANTKGKIADIVPDPLPKNAVMYLINAVYFYGPWKYRFDPAKTIDATFTSSEGNISPCRLMILESAFSYYENDLFQSVDLPYGNGNYAMVVLLPKEGIASDVVVNALSGENWNTWTSSFEKKSGRLELPRFKTEFKKSLVDPLKTMGMEIAFGAQADFTGIDKNGELFISEVMHKTFVEVSEEGTEAAAATSVEISRNSAGETFTMSVRKPFLIAIRELHTGAILFIGRINDVK